MTERAAGSVPALGRWAVVVAGAVALAVAMGIGRFAFTPLLPMMLHDGVIDLPAASWLASANYLGYLAGALLCTFQPWIWARVPRLPPIDAPWMLRAGLVATGVLTLGMAVPWPAGWPLLRFAAGVASALVFVYTSGWVLSQMARLQAPAMGGVMYTGPGAGIVVSGLFASAMVQWHWHAAEAWLVFGVLAFGLSALVWRTFARGETARPAAVAGAGAAVASEPHGALEIGFLCAAYGIAGFGYIVTA
ncbi:MAG: YbfB/YjiJ family MFS transporter, partial [Burkholderiaceae bacterium]